MWHLVPPIDSILPNDIIFPNKQLEVHITQTKSAKTQASKNKQDKQY